MRAATVLVPEMDVKAQAQGPRFSGTGSEVWMRCTRLGLLTDEAKLNMPISAKGGNSSAEK